MFSFKNDPYLSPKWKIFTNVKHRFVGSLFELNVTKFVWRITTVRYFGTCKIQFVYSQHNIKYRWMSPTNEGKIKTNRWSIAVSFSLVCSFAPIRERERLRAQTKTSLVIWFWNISKRSTQFKTQNCPEIYVSFFLHVIFCVPPR